MSTCYFLEIAIESSLITSYEFTIFTASSWKLIAIRGFRWFTLRPIAVKNATLYFHLLSWYFSCFSSKFLFFLLFSFLFLMKYQKYQTIICDKKLSVELYVRVKQSMWQLCLNFKMSKFTLKLNQSYQRPQFSQTMSIRLQRRIQNPAKHVESLKVESLNDANRISYSRPSQNKRILK